MVKRIGFITTIVGMLGIIVCSVMLSAGINSNPVSFVPSTNPVSGVPHMSQPREMGSF